MLFFNRVLGIYLIRDVTSEQCRTLSISTEVAMEYEKSIINLLFTVLLTVTELLLVFNTPFHFQWI